MKHTISIIVLLGFSLSIFGQNEKTLEECIQYALENHASIKNAQLDYESSKAKVGETRAIGLPQINGKWEVVHNFEVQSQFFPNEEGTFFYNPFLPVGESYPVQFGINNSSNASITATQLIFDGSYIMGLKAANTYKDLYKNSITKSKNEVAASVSKAYYMVLITQERLKQLEENEQLLTKLSEDTKVLIETGMVESIELKRTQVNLNNIRAEMQKLKSLERVTLDLLHFQMGMPLSEELSLSESLSSITVETTPAVEGTVYENNPDYKMLQVQKELNSINLKNEKIRFLPNLGAFYSLGANYGSNNFGDIFGFDNYADYSMIGASLNVPIFSSGQRKYRVDQARIELEKVNNTIELTQQSIEVQASQYQKQLVDNMKVLKTQEESKELAEEVYEVTKAKFEEGLASNFEVLSAQTDMTTAQTNYYSALYDVLVSKIELNKVLGTINEN